MASREDILPGEDEISTKTVPWKSLSFGFLCLVFLVLSISINWSKTILNPIVWMDTYSKLWVFFTLPYLAMRNSSVNR